MRTPSRFLIPLAVGLWLAAGLRCVFAQEPAAAPAPLPAPPAAPAAEPAPYSLDLPDLRPPANSGLFPNGPRQNPPPTTANGTGRNGRSSKFNTGGSKARGRSRDRTLQKADSDPLDIRVAYRRDKTQALARDPDLLELSHRAETASTDTEKRRLLQEYYTRLFASIRRVNSSSAMKAHLDLLAQVAAQQYNPQRRAVSGEEDLLNGRDVGRGWLGR